MKNSLKTTSILLLGLILLSSFYYKDIVPDRTHSVTVQNSNPVVATPVIKAYDFLKKDKFCWRESYGRGVGTVPTICPNGMEFQAGLCYQLCKSGYKGVGPVCWATCPDGFRDDGAFCAKPTRYGRGGGFIWKIGDKVGSTAGMFSRCEQVHGKGNCEKYGAIVYPKCKEGFTNDGCCFCSPKCPDGWTNIGVSCTKPSYGRGVGVVPTICANGKENNAGLCYTLCKTGFVGVGPVCWESVCPTIDGKQWVNCGAGCAETNNECATAIIDMVTTPLIAVLNIAGMIVTGGASGGATAGAGAAVTATTKAGKVIKYTAKAVKGVSSVSKQVIKNDLIAKAKEQLNGKPMPPHQLKGIEEYAEMAYDAARTYDFDWRDFTAIDPTGLANVAAAYANPLCKNVRSSGSSTTGSGETPSSSTMAPASPGYVRIQNAWKKDHYLHNQNGRLEEGSVKANWWSAQWKVINAGGGFVRIQNKWKPSEYLHNEKGSIQAGAMQPNWWSAQWKIIPVRDGWARIQNKWKPNQYLHNQNGKIEVGPIQNNWASALWKLE